MKKCGMCKYKIGEICSHPANNDTRFQDQKMNACQGYKLFKLSWKTIGFIAVPVMALPVTLIMVLMSWVWIGLVYVLGVWGGFIYGIVKDVKIMSRNNFNVRMRNQAERMKTLGEFR